MLSLSDMVLWLVMGGLVLGACVFVVAVWRAFKSSGSGRPGNRPERASARGDSDEPLPFASSFSSSDDHTGSHHGHHHTDGGGTGHDGGSGDGGGSGSGDGGGGGGGDGGGDGD
jgi:hypothetical protein